MNNVLRFDEVGIGDIASVGGKNASLGEMVRALAGEGVRVPGGFATTADAFCRYLEGNGLNAPIAGALERLKQGTTTLAEAGKAIRALILGGEFSESMRLDLCASYRQLAREIGAPNPAVAVRSSATAEDPPNASFAGQQETFARSRYCLISYDRRTQWLFGRFLLADGFKGGKRCAGSKDGRPHSLGSASQCPQWLENGPKPYVRNGWKADVRYCRADPFEPTSPKRAEE